MTVRQSCGISDELYLDWDDLVVEKRLHGFNKHLSDLRVLAVPDVVERKKWVSMAKNTVDPVRVLSLLVPQRSFTDQTLIVLPSWSCFVPGPGSRARTPRWTGLLRRKSNTREKKIKGLPKSKGGCGDRQRDRDTFFFVRSARRKGKQPSRLCVLQGSA